MRTGDEVSTELLHPLRQVLAREAPDVVYLPQGIGGHADRRQLTQAFLVCGWKGATRWYRDTPYIIRDSSALRDALVPASGRESAVVFGDEFLEKKIAARTAYTTQIGFLFGSAEG